MQAYQEILKPDLNDAVECARERARAAPTDPQSRLQLAVVLSVACQWDRARRQFESAGQLDPGISRVLSSYQLAIDAELHRDAVFKGTLDPVVAGFPSEADAQHLARAVAAIRSAALAARGEGSPADVLVFDDPRDRDDAPRFSANGGASTTICDSDTRLAPALELFVHGRYTWLPFASIQSLQILRTGLLGDLLWSPVVCTVEGGTSLFGVVPTRYHSTVPLADAELRYGFATEWIESPPDCFIGLGHRQFLGDDESRYSLFELRTLERCSGND